MSAITQASAHVAKTVAVSTGKVTNAKSMMVWKPHGNKYVFVERDVRRARAWSRAALARIIPRATPRVASGGRRARALGDAARATKDARGIYFFACLRRARSFALVVVARARVGGDLIANDAPRIFLGFPRVGVEVDDARRRDRDRASA
jgi:hypothetical protein